MHYVYCVAGPEAASEAAAEGPPGQLHEVVAMLEPRFPKAAETLPPPRVR